MANDYVNDSIAIWTSALHHVDTSISRFVVRKSVRHRVEKLFLPFAFNAMTKKFLVFHFLFLLSFN